MLSTLVERWRARRRSSVPVASPEAAVAPPVALVDSMTRTFWTRGEPVTRTLVEADGSAAAPSVGRRVAALVADRERPRRRPVTDPAFSEALFVELLRERRYDRAFALLTPECQASWGTAGAFASAQRDSSVPVGVDVRDVRQLAWWTDPDTGVVHRDVAELDVEYAVRISGRAVTVPRTVHLVAHDGRWRSLCYGPPAHAA